MKVNVQGRNSVRIYSREEHARGFLLEEEGWSWQRELERV